MNRNRLIILYVSFIFLISLVFTGCAPRVAETPGPAGATDKKSIIFTLVGPDGEKTFTMDELKSLPVSEGQAGIISSTGQISIPEPFKGVAIKDLVNSMSVPFDPSMGVTITAVDGYSMALSYDQVINGSFIAYDPAAGKELPLHDPLTAIIAYERSGGPLNATEEGALRLAVISEKNNQVVDGHWSVKWVNKVEVKTVGETWVLNLTGALSSPVTRDSFQSCGSPSCHGKAYQDESGQSWMGVPLWVLVGEVDDEDTHSEEAYNIALAEAGYTIDITSLDGKTVTLDSQLVKKDDQILIAHSVNEGELPDLYYPLRLVGTSVLSDQMLGQISDIMVNVPPIPAPTLEEVEENAGSLTIAGLVNQELILKDADLRMLEIVNITAEGKDGPQDFQGVLLNPILDMAGIKNEATKLVFTASDGYSAVINLSDLRNSPQALLAFMETPGEYMVVLPDQPTSSWVKNIIKIDVE